MRLSRPRAGSVSYPTPATPCAAQMGTRRSLSATHIRVSAAALPMRPPTCARPPPHIALHGKLAPASTRDTGRAMSQEDVEMKRVFLTPAAAPDAAAVTEVVRALESSLYGESRFSQADLEDEWRELDPEQNVRVVRAGDRIVGYGAVCERGELWNVEGCVHPDALGRGIGKLIANTLEEEARRGGAGRIRNDVFEADSAARKLLESLSYRAVHVELELRIELDAPPAPPDWPEGLRIVPFDPQRDALEFHAAVQEAFADTWDFTPRNFEWWSKRYLESARFDPTLWCVVRAGDE